MKADNLTIARVFWGGGDVHYVLPHFQREYTWDRDNWATLFDDALGVLEESRNMPDPTAIEHFRFS
jgi:uncharacterized protein with ParB-like and HNH nuclease domain